MPVGLYPGPNSYTAGAGAMVFPYSFRILNKTHLLVQVNGVTKVVDSDYTVSGVGNSTGGNVTFLTPMVGGETVLISRNVPYKRDTDYQANGDFREDTVDSDFDLEEMQTQQLAAAITRTLKAPLSITADQVFSEADWAARASKFVTFDGAGALTLLSVFAPGALTVSAFIQTLLDDADAATARGTLKGSVISRAANTIFGVADIGNVIRATAGYTQTFSAAATLGNGWWVPYRVEAGATIVFDPNGAETIDGAATKTIVGLNSGIIYCDGSALYTVGFGLPLSGGTLIGALTLSGDPKAALQAAAARNLTKTIYGLVPSYGGGDQFTLSAGGAMDSTGVYFMTLASQITKLITSAWAVGDGNGGRDTGADSNNEWYVWLIARSDTGVVDALLSLSSTAPTMPPNYNFKRLVGYFRRLAGTNTVWTAHETEGGGLDYSWDVPTLDINLANTLTTARRTDAVKVPTSFSTIAHLNIQVTDVSAPFVVWICCPDQTDAAPSQTAAPLSNVQEPASGTAGISYQLKIRTSTAGLIAARANLATVDLYAVSTMGFTWARRE